jgi:hypothetical protein
MTVSAGKTPTTVCDCPSQSRRDIRISRSTSKDRAVEIFPEHPPIEVARRAAGGRPMMTRIDKVRAGLKRLNRASLLTQRG